MHEIYQLGLKHGMQLAAISGVKGVFSNEDIERVRTLALAARKQAQPARKRSSPATPAPAAPRAAALKPVVKRTRQPGARRPKAGPEPAPAAPVNRRAKVARAGSA